MPRSAPMFAAPLDTIRRVLAIVRRIIGVPDYDRYLTHMTAHHPDVTPLTAREFEIVRMNDRYSRPGSRCC